LYVKAEWTEGKTKLRRKREESNGSILLRGEVGKGEKEWNVERESNIRLQCPIPDSRHQCDTVR